VGILATKHDGQHPVIQSPVGFGWRWFTPTARYQGHKSTAVKSLLSTAITESSLITDTDQWDDSGRAAKQLLFTDWSKDCYSSASALWYLRRSWGRQINW